MKLFGKEMSYRELQSYIGNLSQIGGITPYQFDEGRAKGVRAFDVRTGGGLRYNVIADRCLDVCNFEYKGVPLAFVAKAGISGPWFYESPEEGWARTFDGGLFTTCGFTNAGMVCDMDGKHYGLHGRASALPAYEVGSCSRATADGGLEFEISGKVSEVNHELECITRHRTITSQMGGKSIKVVDTYVNERFTPEPLLLIYHCNFGFPLVSPDAEMVADIASTIPFTAKFPDTADNMDEVYQIKPPAADAQTHVFLHKVNGDGQVSVGVRNEKLGLGVKVTYDNRVLPYFTQANIFKKNDYYLVLEPSNCYPLGRLEQSKQYGLEILEPGQTKTVELTFEVEEL